MLNFRDRTRSLKQFHADIYYIYFLINVFAVHYIIANYLIFIISEFSKLAFAMLLQQFKIILLTSIRNNSLNSHLFLPLLISKNITVSIILKDFFLKNYELFKNYLCKFEKVLNSLKFMKLDWTLGPRFATPWTQKTGFLECVYVYVYVAVCVSVDF